MFYSFLDVTLFMFIYIDPRSDVLCLAPSLLFDLGLIILFGRLFSSPCSLLIFVFGCFTGSWEGILGNPRVDSGESLCEQWGGVGNVQ